jgi:hypothetical protein
MAMTFDRGGPPATREERFLARGSMGEVLTGGGALVLPILGLLGVLPLSAAAVAFVAIGGGLVIQAGELRALRSYGERADHVGGMTPEILGGAVVSLLGLLALLRFLPMTLLSVAAIVGGASLVWGASASARLGRPRLVPPTEASRQLLRESVGAEAGADVLVGLAAVTLGILVIGGVGTARVHLPLLLVAALALGAGLFLNGTAVGERMPPTRLRRWRRPSVT